MEENKFFKQAREELAYLSGDENFKFLVHDRAMFLMDQDAREKQGFADGLAIGKAEGITSGKKEKQIEIAKKLLELHIPIEQIIIATGLSKKEVESLDIKNNIY